MSLHFKINPPVYVDATATGRARPVFFDVKPQFNGSGGGVGVDNNNQLGSFMSKTDSGFQNHLPRDAFTGQEKGIKVCRMKLCVYFKCGLL